jgi:hypothetical protein
MPTLTAAQVARVAIDALRTDDSGIRVLGVAQIGDLLKKAPTTGQRIP